MPGQGVPTIAIVIFASFAAVALFLALNGQRMKTSQPMIQPQGATPIVSPPPLKYRVEQTRYDTQLDDQMRPMYAPAVRQASERFPSLNSPKPASPPTSKTIADTPYFSSNADVVQTNRLTENQQLKASALVIDRGQKIQLPTTVGGLEGEGLQLDVARPERINNPSGRIVAGTLIPAILETPLDTSRGGFARAIISSDVRSFDGRNILIPKGGKLIGQYGSDVAAGQDRVLLIWERISLPDGRQIVIEAPSADARGAAGIPGKVHGNFVGRFLNSLLQTGLNIATFRASSKASAGTVIIGPNGFPSSAESSNAEGYRRKITVPAGQSLSVFVSQDIDFGTGSDSGLSRQ